MLRSATITIASARPAIRISTSTATNQGDSATPAVVAPIRTVPANSARDSLPSFSIRPASDPITDPAPQAPISMP